MDQVSIHRPLVALPLALALALLAPAGWGAPPGSSTNQTLQQVLGNRQTLPLPLDPNLRLQQDQAYRRQLQQQELLNQGAAAGRRQQSIQDSGTALQQMRQQDLDAARQQQQQFQQQQIEGQDYQYFQDLRKKAR